MTIRNFAYSIVDVFAERALEGNPLAVFHDARGLSDAEMQALARETNLAETTFVVPGDPAEEANSGVRVRIFTTQEELPFAGHPTLGTASWLRFHDPRFANAAAVTLRLNAGPITVSFEESNGSEPGVRGRMQQKNPVFGTTHSRSAIATALGLAAEDLSESHAPQTVSTGLPFCIVLLRSLEVSARLAIAQREAQRYLDNCDAKFFYCIAPTGRSGADAAWHARMQFYGGEDPATGSAAGCAISWLVQHGLVASALPVILEQGVEILRPARITAQATRSESGVNNVLVGGRTIPVASGSFFLP